MTLLDSRAFRFALVFPVCIHPSSCRCFCLVVCLACLAATKQLSPNSLAASAAKHEPRKSIRVWHFEFRWSSTRSHRSAPKTILRSIGFGAQPAAQSSTTQRNVTQTNPTQPNEIQCNAMRCDATRRNATQTRVTQTTNGNERGQTPLTGAINHSSRIALAGACSNLGPSDFFPRSKLRASMGTRCPHAIQLVSWGLCTRKMKLEFASQCNGLLAVQLLQLQTLLLSKILEEPISITGQTFAI